VIIAAVIIKFYPAWVIADPICTLLFAVIVMFTTTPIIKSCVHLMMEGSPEGLDVEEFKS
jgi:Co/Zn/Cd efflux system component